MPHQVGERLYYDPETDEVEAWRDIEALLVLLEKSTRDQFLELMRAPDVIDGIAAVLSGRDQKVQRRLQRALSRQSVPRSGAPIKAAENRTDLRMAIEVLREEIRIAEPYGFVEMERQKRRVVWTEENRDYLAKEYGLSIKQAKILCLSKSLPAAASRMVAERLKSSVARVRMAARRGQKHPQFLSTTID